MRVVWPCLFDVISFWCTFQSNFVPLWDTLCDYTVLKNSYTGQYLLWSNLSAITMVFSYHFMKVCRKWSEGPSIFSKLQVFESIHEGFSFSVTLKADFCNNVLLQIFSLVEACCIEIRALLAATLQKLLPQVSFLGISLNILTIFSKSPILDVCLTSEFFSALLHNSYLNGYMALILLS